MHNIRVVEMKFTFALVLVFDPSTSLVHVQRREVDRRCTFLLVCAFGLVC